MWTALNSTALVGISAESSMWTALNSTAPEGISAENYMRAVLISTSAGISAEVWHH
jgi:hypothetical protein